MDKGRVTGQATQLWPQVKKFWQDSDEAEPCNLTCARVIDSRKNVTIPQKKWAAIGSHYFEDTEGDDLWYESFGSRLEMWY